MLDTIGVSTLSGIVGLAGMLSIVMTPQAHILIVAGLYCFDVFLLGSNFRIILAYCKYRKWEVIICKLIIGICCIIYMSIGAYFMRNNFDHIPLTNKD